MATHHALPNEIIDLETWARDLDEDRSKAIARTDDMELARLFLRAGQEFATHKVSGPIVVQCIRGEIEFTARSVTQALKPGQLLHLTANEPHSVKAVSDSVVLLIIIFKRSEPQIP
jgi:quercetin dioxygenase-like cupin family protein